MQEKTIKVYTFDELSEDAKNLALTSWREGNDYYFLEDILTDDLSEKLRENKIEELSKTSLRYSLNNCQGDGLSFTGSFRWKDSIINITDGSLSNLYAHSNTTDININVGDFEQESDADENMYKEFKTLYDAICWELEKLGYSYIEDEDNEETIRENFNLNEYTFRENGVVEII